MAFVVPTKRGKFELRESRSTPDGPRSRTLASFGELDDEVIEKARARAGKPLDPDILRAAARRAGAPVAPLPVDRAARGLLAELGRGSKPEPRLRRLLGAMLDQGPMVATSPLDPGVAVAEWMDSTSQERGSALVDLLLLGDALPHGGRMGKPLLFPRLESKPA